MDVEGTSRETALFESAGLNLDGSQAGLRAKAVRVAPPILNGFLD